MSDLTSRFLESIAKTPLGANEGWPLTGPEIVPYFDVDQAIDVYDMVMELYRQKKTYKEIGLLFQTPTMMRYHLTMTLTVGLKIAKLQKIRDISIEERLKFFDIYFKSLEALVDSDPFCSDEKNLVIPRVKLQNAIESLQWVDIRQDNKKMYNHLAVDLFFYPWTLYYNLFASAGFEVHGPYDVTVGDVEYELVVRENFNMRPVGIWDVDPGIDSAKLYLLYKKGTKYRLSYYNQPMTEDHNENLVKAAFKIDGKNIVNTESIQLISKKLSLLSENLAKHINSLSNYDQMMKGAEISFFMLRKLYEYFDRQPDVKSIVERTYKILGDTNLTKGPSEFHERKTKEWVDLFDPRTDSLGPIKL